MAHDSHGTDQVTWDSDLSEPRNFDDRALATHMMPHTPARLHAACSMHISSKRSSNLRPAAMQLKIATCNMATNTVHDTTCRMPATPCNVQQTRRRARHVGLRDSGRVQDGAL